MKGTMDDVHYIEALQKEIEELKLQLESMTKWKEHFERLAEYGNLYAKG